MSRKTLSILLTTLMLLNIALVALTPLIIPTVKAARGNPILAAVNTTDLTNFYGIVEASYNVSIKAGEQSVSKVDNNSAYAGWQFAIVFAKAGQWIVNFDGSQFYLYISDNGLAQLNTTTDIRYAGPFKVSDLVTAGLKSYTFRYPALKGGQATFYIGNVSIGGTYYSLIIGPIPFDITIDYKYIKIFDGLTTQVAVSRAIVDVLPSISLEPTWGPGGRMVTLKGVALQPNALLNLTYSGASANTDVFSQVRTDSKGKFSYTWSIKDLKSGWIDTGPIPTDTIEIHVWYNETGAHIDYVSYTEYRRAFVQLRSQQAEHEALPFADLYTGAGNSTLTVKAYVFDTIVIAGTWWNPRYAVEIYISGNKVASTLPNETHGFFNTSFTVPELPRGTNVVEVRNGDVSYTFTINVLPTLRLVPREGHIGDEVQALVYGFPANSLVKIYWDTLCEDSNLKYNVNIVNGTTGPDGKFNVTVKFKVPKAPGGTHNVTATADGTSATAEFTVLLRIRLDVTTFNATYGKVVKIVGEGLDPTATYQVAVDNSYLGQLGCDACGYAEGKIIGAGFRPGLHAVALYSGTISNLVAHSLFYVTPEGDILAILSDTLGSMIADLQSILTSVQGDVALIKTDVGVIKADVSTIKSLVEKNNAVLTSVQGDVALIKTDVGDIKADVSAIKPVIISVKDDVAIIKTEIGVIKADVSTIKSLVEKNNAVLTSVQGDVALIKTDVGDIKADVSAIKPVIISVKDDVAIIKTEIGNVKASIDALKPVVTSINGTVATIKTTLGDVQGTVITIKDNVATIMTDVGVIKADVSAVKSDVADVKGGVSTVSTMVIIAVVLSVVAAATSIYSVIALRRALVH
jgi:peptidoglycan hydrolase CwlO-like protein